MSAPRKASSPLSELRAKERRIFDRRRSNVQLILSIVTEFEERWTVRSRSGTRYGHVVRYQSSSHWAAEGVRSFGCGGFATRDDAADHLILESLKW